MAAAILCLKIVMVTLNVVTMMFGLSCVVAGRHFYLLWDGVREYFQEDEVEFAVTVQTTVDTWLRAAVTFGAILMVISPLCILGICCKIRALWIAYAIVIFVLALTQISVAAYLVGLVEDKVDDDSKIVFKDTLRNYNETSSTKRAEAWRVIFDLGQCCAVTDYRADFKANPFIPNVEARSGAGITGTSIPITCCKDVGYEDDLTVELFKDKSECLNTPGRNNAYTEGCYPKLKEWIDHFIPIFTGVGTTILSIEITEILLACVLFFTDVRPKI